MRAAIGRFIRVGSFRKGASGIAGTLDDGVADERRSVEPAQRVDVRPGRSLIAKGAAAHGHSCGWARRSQL
jgi:hypothetical protein